MHALVQGLPKVKARADRMAGVTEAPGQGYELAVVSRQYKEHEERATLDIILEDDVAGGIGAGEPGERVDYSRTRHARRTVRPV